LHLCAYSYGIEGFKVHGTEVNARQIEFIECRSKLFRLDPIGCKHLERDGVSYADGKITQLAYDTGHGIEKGRMGMGDVGRRRDPLQSGLR